MAASLKKLKILYIEDDEATMIAMSRFLKRRVGCLVAAADGREGLKLYYSERPDIIIVDLLLPEEGGIELIRKIRETDRRSKIIVTSTVDSLETIKNAVDLKIEYYIVKPVNISIFEKQINAVADDITAETDDHDEKIHFDSYILRDEAEHFIKTKVAKLIKDKTGRGPEFIKVNFYDNSIELIISGAFTPMDLSLLSEKRNISIVELYRRLVYETATGNIQTIVSDTVAVSLKVKEIDVDVNEQLDRIVLEYEL